MQNALDGRAERVGDQLGVREAATRRVRCRSQLRHDSACDSKIVDITSGIVLGVQSVRRRGEEFTLYEAGFVHSWGTKTTGVPWTDVVTVTDVGKKTFLSKAFGGDVGCQVRTTGGRKVVINAFTNGAELLIHRVFEATGGRSA